MTSKILSNISYILGLVFIINPLMGVGSDVWFTYGNLCLLLSLVLNFVSSNKRISKFFLGFKKGSCLVGLVFVLLYNIVRSDVISIAYLTFVTIVVVYSNLRKENYVERERK